MLDFLMVAERPTKRGVDIYPKFVMRKSTDLMIRGGDFYAIWVESQNRWSTDEQDAIQLIDQEINAYVKEHFNSIENVRVLYMWDSSSGMIDTWHKYCQKQCRDDFHMLDEELIFSNTEITKKDYASKRLNYSLEKGPTPSYEKLISTLYSPEERHKIEWAIGCIVTGDSKHVQKFLVLYGAAGTGKSTVLNIIQQLFEGYYSVFDAKALGSSSNSFALEAFKTNPLVAIQHDGDLSRIEDNTRLNSLVSHELMTVNEKFKSTYSNRFKSFLFMGTNRPVKITDSRSGLLRRLIDVTPSGKKVSPDEYDELVGKIPFELGGIAYHCMKVYQENPNYYDRYVPVNMLGASNDMYNFVADAYYDFKKANGVSLKIAWEKYKAYCEDANVSFPFSQRVFREELKEYFKDFKDRYTPEGSTEEVRNYYIEFLDNKFAEMRPDASSKAVKKKPESWLQFNCTESLLDDEFAELPAQYGNEEEKPSFKWEGVKTKLRDIDTHKIHYVKLPDVTHIVVDFDIKDDDGHKSFQKNLEAASKWPATYAELSKSGEGIHLHYIYTGGDPTKLKRIYSENVEIKVFTGKSSLRRKLTKCNDIPIATISSGLPTKGEDKVVNFESIKSEKRIRNLIQRNLAKEIHPGTKPSIDFIKKILDDAYESGLHYDVGDMRQAILNFALHSTNHADYCIKMVNDMKFKSDEPEENTVTAADDEPIVFYDIEVFPNLFLVNWKFEGLGKTVVRMINPSPTDMEALLKHKLVGFNCRRYDNHLVYARMLGYSNEQLYQMSQRIISGDRSGFLGEAYNVSYTDVYDFASSGNKKSLKKLEIEMSNKANDPNSKMDDNLRKLLKDIKHHELGLPWDQPVPEELWMKVAEYCDDDVIATEAAFRYLSADWTARQILADLAEMTVNDTTNTLTTRIIFGKNKKPQNEFCYRNLAEPVLELAPEVEKFLRMACPDMMAERHGEAKSLLPYFPSYKYEFGKSVYRGEDVSEGGYVYAEPGMHVNVALLDIASMHPHSTIAECLFGPRFTAAYRDIVEGRVSIKHEAWDIVNGMLDGKLTKFIQRVRDGEMTSGDLANALKTAINSVYGLTDAKFENPFRDPRNIDNIVAKRGALFMVDLKYEVQKRGYTVAHIKTDSIKIPNATPEIIQFVMDFGKRYGYTFEHEATYDRMCLVNNSVYIAKYKNPAECEKMYGYIPEKNKKKFENQPWTATGEQFAVPYLFKTLFSHEPVIFSDLCETFSVSKGALYLDMNEKLPDVSAQEASLKKCQSLLKRGKMTEEDYTSETERLTEEIKNGHDLKFVGRVGQFTPILPGHGGGILYRVHEGKNYAANGSIGYRWLESETVRLLGMEDAVDRNYYDKLVNDAIEDISKYGDFEWFVSDDPVPEPEKPLPDFMNLPEGEEELPFD